MTRSNKIQWKRLSVEAATIVASILLAFAVDAWWDERNQAEKLQRHMSALLRDFEQMSERARASFANSKRAAESGSALLAGFSTQKEWEYEAAMQLITNIGYYEVFSPSFGGYESLVNSGAIESLQNEMLKRNLVEFFGSFEDMRASENQLVSIQRHLILSSEYSRLVGVYRLPIPGFPKADAAPVDEWNDSEEFRNAVAFLTLSQMDVMEDYGFLLQRIDSIREAISDEVRTN